MNTNTTTPSSPSPGPVNHGRTIDAWIKLHNVASVLIAVGTVAVLAVILTAMSAAHTSAYAQGKAWAVQNYNNGDTASVTSPQVLVEWATQNVPASDTGNQAEQWASGAIAGYYVNHGRIGPSANAVAQSVVSETAQDGTAIESARPIGTVTIAANGAATVPVELTFSDGTVYDGTATLYVTGNNNLSTTTQIG